MRTPPETQIADLLSRIRVQGPQLTQLSDSLREALKKFPAVEFESFGIEYWRVQSLCDSVIRIRIFIDRNFQYIETLGLLALCRYTFELVVWLKSIAKDERFALVYARMLMKQQIETYQDLAKHLEREITLYEKLALEEKQKHEALLDTAATEKSVPLTAESIVDALHSASDEVDEKLATNFAIYSDQVGHFGYSFLAHNVRAKALKAALENTQQCQDSLTRFNAHWATTISELKLKEWKWRVRAEYVGMEHEYDFIYSYTSRLLHANPSSLTTDQKSLENEEVLLFIRYLAIQFKWIHTYAKQFALTHRMH